MKWWKRNWCVVWLVGLGLVGVGYAWHRATRPPVLRLEISIPKNTPPDPAVLEAKMRAIDEEFARQMKELEADDLP